MNIHRWLMPLVIAMAAEAAARADGPELTPAPRAAAASPNAAIDPGDGGGQGNASEPVLGGYQFLLEVAGVTPDAPSQERKRSAGSPLRRDPHGAGKAVDSAD